MIEAITRIVPATHRPLAVQMLRFGTVGTVCFVIDTAVVYALRGSIGLYAAGLISFLVAVTAGWAMNRAWTFRGLGEGPRHRQWVKFVSANVLGFLLNRGTYAILVTVSALCAENPILATAAGAIAGMGVNFVMARRVVFR